MRHKAASRKITMRYIKEKIVDENKNKCLTKKNFKTMALTYVIYEKQDPMTKEKNWHQRRNHDVTDTHILYT